MINTHSKPAHVREITDRCERGSAGEVTITCPLCGGEYTLQTLEKHLGLHLQDVALFALPHLGEGSSKSWPKTSHLGEGSSKHWSKIPHLGVSEYSRERSSSSEDSHGGQSTGCQLISEIRCICGYQHEDEFLVTCNKCNELQHGLCMDIKGDNVAEVYECSVCEPGSHTLNITAAIKSQEGFLKSEEERKEKERKEKEREEKEREEREWEWEWERERKKNRAKRP